MAEREQLQQQLDRLKERRDWIQANPMQHANDRIQQIDRALKGRQGGPGSIQPRPATHAGNVSMHEHLSSIKAAYQLERRQGGRVDQDIMGMDRRIEQLERELAQLEGDS